MTSLRRTDTLASLQKAAETKERANQENERSAATRVLRAFVDQRDDWTEADHDEVASALGLDRGNEGAKIVLPYDWR